MCKSVSRYLCLMVFLALSLAAATAADDPTKGERLARDAATRFFKALNARRLDELMKVADIPWWFDDEEVVEDRDVLRKRFKEIVEELGDRRFPTEAKKVLTYAEARKKIKDPRTLAVLDKLLDRKDRLVGFGKDGEEHCVLVRIRDGKARVVGGCR